MFPFLIANKFKIFSYLLVTSLITGSYFIAYKFGSNSGKESIQFLWNQEKLERAEYTNALMNEYAEKEIEHRLAIRNIKNELNKVKSNYNESIAFIELEYVDRLQQSTNRETVYKRQAESGTSGCRLLSEHTIKLDQSITEGRRLVGELSETVRQCGAGVDLLVKFIEADRELLD